MPITMAEIDKSYKIVRISGTDAIHQHLKELGFVAGEEVKVISKKAEAIRTAILRDVERGCTMLYGQGGYSNQPTQVVMSVVSSRELAKTERLIHAIDPECFIILSKASEVQGEGFSQSPAL